MSRLELLKYLFTTKLDRDEVAYFFANVADTPLDLTRERIRRIVKGFEIEETQRIMDNRRMNEFIEAVFELKEQLDGFEGLQFSNSEGIAVMCYAYKKLLGKHPTKDAQQEAIFEAIDLWRAGGEDWDKLMAS